MARNELNITYYPEGARDLNDGIAIGHLVKILVGESRQRGGGLIKKSRQSFEYCGMCGRAWDPYRTLQIHHKKPLWATAMELVLANLPQSYEEYKAMWEDMFFGRVALDSNVHRLDNLEMLCRKCHAQAEVKAFQQWKAHFTAAGRIVIGNDIGDHQQYLSEKIEYMPKWR